MKPFMVQLAERTWTLQAMHLACAMARDEGASVVLLYLMKVDHILWLGTELGDLPPTDQDHQLLNECESVAELYGVTLSLEWMQCHTLVGALTQAADALDAQGVFAQLPQSKLAFLNPLQHWNLKRQLKAQRRELYTLEQPDEAAWTPAVTVKASR
jgi:hypothetical protein